MEDAIIEANLKKYHQTETSCPFMKEPVKSQVGDYGETTKVDEVLAGNYKAISNVDEPAELFLRTCKATNVTTDMQRSPEQFKQSWSKMKEKASSHDLHFGHFKAASEHEKNLLVH